MKRAPTLGRQLIWAERQAVAARQRRERLPASAPAKTVAARTADEAMAAAIVASLRDLALRRTPPRARPLRERYLAARAAEAEIAS